MGLLYLPTKGLTLLLLSLQYVLCFTYQIQVHLSLFIYYYMNFDVRKSVHHRIYLLFCIYLRTNSDLCHLQHKLIGFYNRDKKCLLRGTNWVFK